MDRSTRLAHEKQAVCIVNGEGVYVGRSTRLGHENKVVCILDAYVERSGLGRGE